MPALTLMDVLAMFVFAGVAAIGWHTGSWAINRLLPK